jgi:hypothetical protein
VRRQSFNLYTHPERVLPPQECTGL